MLITAEMEHASLVELKKLEVRQLQLTVLQREDAILDKIRKLAALLKRQAKLGDKRDKFAPIGDKARTKRYLQALRVLREVDQALAFCRNWIAQRSRVLRDKRGKLARLKADRAAGRVHWCFASTKLLAQRPGEHNPQSPFASLDEWRAAWTAARDSQWWSVGHTAKPRGNAAVQWLPETKQLRVRLTDRRAHERMDVPTGLEATRPVTREAGVLGLDFNARGLAWCAVQPDGNRMRDQHGLLSWDLKGLPAGERRQAIGTVVAQLTRHAKRLKLAMAIENLDFSTKKLMARAGRVNKRYNDMLGSLPCGQFEEMASRACEREHLMLYSLNPLCSSVGGFAKYGCPLRMNADTSAALWVGRQALFGALGRAGPTRASVKQVDERLGLLPPASHPDAAHDGPGRNAMERCRLGLGLEPKALGRKAPALL